jgi:glucose-6-phosphate 1-dehydrogenase
MTTSQTTPVIPTIIVLVGITGDLSKRKLLPAIDGLAKKGMLPNDFKLVGITRRDNVDINGLLGNVADKAFLQEHTTLFTMDLDSAEGYKKLSDELDSIEKDFGNENATPAQRLFYLSVAPTVSLPIIEQLGNSGLAKHVNTKLMLEKPFGIDLENAESTIKEIDQHFDESQVYRVDHYLAKQTVRALVDHSIQLDAVAHIDVTAAEKIAIEGRADFYEQTGALRDFVQSHLLQVAAMVINPKNRLAVLKNLSVDLPHVKRGQYEGYREAAGNPDSAVETFVSVPLLSKDDEGFLLTVQSGKALDRKSTDVTITYKDGATEVISLNDATNAYESVYYDAIMSDKQFFVTKDEVLETWRILKPVQEAWKKDSADLILYKQGTNERDIA